MIAEQGSRRITGGINLVDVSKSKGKELIWKVGSAVDFMKCFFSKLSVGFRILILMGCRCEVRENGEGFVCRVKKSGCDDDCRPLMALGG